MINNCPRLTYSAIADNPEGGQSVKATFLMRKTSKKGAKRFCFVWALAKRLYRVIKNDAKFVICHLLFVTIE